MQVRTRAILALLTIVPTVAVAQERRVHRPFSSWMVGAEAGTLEHHAAATVFQYDSGGELGTNRRVTFNSHGVGGGLFGGHDWAISDRARVGIEVSGAIGGKTNMYAYNGGRLLLEPRYGLKLAARAGYVLTPRMMVYGLTGYGIGHYDVRDTIPVRASQTLKDQSGLLLGGGAEYRVDQRFGVRLDYKHVDNDSGQLFVGIPVRF